MPRATTLRARTPPGTVYDEVPTAEKFVSAAMLGDANASSTPAPTTKALRSPLPLLKSAGWSTRKTILRIDQGDSGSSTNGLTVLAQKTAIMTLRIMEPTDRAPTPLVMDGFLAVRQDESDDHEQEQQLHGDLLRCPAGCIPRDPTCAAVAESHQQDSP